VAFVPAANAADLLRLVASGPFAPNCVYPTKANADSLEGEPSIIERLDRLFELERRVIAVKGPHGTGKTFHLLLAAIKWQEKGRERLAFYVDTPAALNPDDIVENWWEPRADTPCLWVIDNVHRDTEGRLETIVRTFRANQFLNHRLVLGGWGLPHNVNPDLQVPLPLLPGTIKLALRTADHSVADHLIDNLAEAKVGLRQILWGASRNEEYLTNPQLLEDQWVEYVIEGLPEASLSLLRLLGCLRFLGPSLPVFSQVMDRLLRGLEARTGLVETEDGVWVLREDEAARALVRHGLRRKPPEEVARAFVESLIPVLRNALDQARLADDFVASLLTTLWRRTGKDIAEWLDLPGENGNPLLKYLIEDRWMRTKFEVIFKRGEMDLNPSARLLRALSNVTAATELASWVPVMAESYLDVRRPLLTQRTVEDPLSWRATATIAALIGEGQLRSEVIQVLRNAAITSAFSNALLSLNLSDLGAVLAGVHRLDTDVFRSTIAQLLPLLPDPWSRLEVVAEKDKSLALALLSGLPTAHIRGAFLAAPRRARAFLSRFHARHFAESRRRINELLREALADAQVPGEAVRRWKSQDVVAFIRTTQHLGRADLLNASPILDTIQQTFASQDGAAIVEVSRALAERRPVPGLVESAAKTLAETALRRQVPLNARIHALSMLSLPIAEKVISSLTEKWRAPEDPRDAFWFMWNAFVIADEIRLQSLVPGIEARWHDWMKNSLHMQTLVSLAGLIAIVSDRSLPSPFAALAAPPQPLTISSPVLLTTAFYALVHTVLSDRPLVSPAASPNDQGKHRGATAWLVSVTEQLKTPSKMFIKSWHGLLPRARRKILRILSLGLDVLRGAEEWQEMALEVAQVVGEADQDDIWDEDMVLRFATIRRLRGNAEAHALLERCRNDWIGRRLAAICRVHAAHGESPLYALESVFEAVAQFADEYPLARDSARRFLEEVLANSQCATPEVVDAIRPRLKLLAD